MPARVSAWAVYEIFESADAQPIFIGITSDAHWQRFCESFDCPLLYADERYATNASRIDARPDLIESLNRHLFPADGPEITRRCERATIPFAFVARPEALFTDPHLQATGAMASTRMPDGSRADLPKLPLRLEGAPSGCELSPPPLPEAAAPTPAWGEVKP